MPRKSKAPTPSPDPEREDAATEEASTSNKAKPEVSSLDMKTNSFEPYPASKAYRLIEPGPVLLVSTGSLALSTHNIMTIGFHMMLQHESPALIGACIGPRECVLAIPDVRIAETVVDIGNCSGDDVDKWTTFGLPAVPAEVVQAPLVGGPSVIANLECVVVDRKMVSKYNLWVLEVVRVWLNPALKDRGRTFHHRGDGTFVVDGEVLDLQERMIKWKEFQD
ncbi:hypothetical protein N7468_008040 [Penicillium chermesinum]|uniref:Flavin reductase like domain-containing protein n=1 Tax=Penicillium chermesinum TaxID=63820 RepID=A0A9W9NPF1_9EURO|nr:uncharacterized protein N7468_008040 [Penicillium chermesinum]KAJ5223498.1 hypothetical protein N7468_008040 [Penicillium chermesinum]